VSDEAGITYLVHARVGRTALLREVLYAIAAQAHRRPRVLIATDEAGAAEASALTVAMSGLVGAAVISSDEAGDPFGPLISEVSTPFYALLTDADVPYPCHAERLVNAIEESGSAHCAVGDGYLVSGRLMPYGYLVLEKRPWAMESIGPGASRPLGATVFRTGSAQDVGVVQGLCARAVGVKVFEHRTEAPS
jgi:hypothetical protein